MIIRQDGTSLLFVTQPDHARLAADLLTHWKGFADHPRRVALLLAAREHDNGWRELDDALVFDSAAGGAGGFFTAAPPGQEPVWARGGGRRGGEGPRGAAPPP